MRIRQEKGKARADGHLDNRQTEQRPQKCFIFGSQYNLIAKFPNPPKENQKPRNQVRLNEKVNRACDNGDNNSDKNIYASIARKSGNDKCPSGNIGNNSQLTYWTFDSGATCHMTPEVSYFIPGLIEDTDKYIEVAEGYHVTAGGKEKVQIKMCDDHGYPFIATLHNVLLALDLCDRLF